MRKWYWYGDPSNFDGFSFTFLEKHINYHGPFVSYDLARKDALEYFDTCIMDARIAIQEIKLHKIERVEKNGDGD